MTRLKVGDKVRLIREYAEYPDSLWAKETADEGGGIRTISDVLDDGSYWTEDALYLWDNTGGNRSLFAQWPWERAVEPEPVVSDNVNSPSHYVREGLGGLDVQDVIEAFDMDFAMGSVVKYVLRAPFKENELQDLKKARNLLDRRIKKMEASA